MKAPNFSYEKPSTLAQAVDLLVRHDGAAVALAGGQSLLATLNLRLSSPEVLVDITGLSELKGISLDGDLVRIGALTRHVDLLQSPIVQTHLPLLGEAIHHVAHAAIRNRGTIGGSVAYADPAAELPACVVALNATIVLQGGEGSRRVPAHAFFRGLFDTDLRPGELIVEFLIPVQAKQQTWAFLELSRRRGDFALAGVAMVADADGSRIAAARVVFFGCSDFPARAEAVAASMQGRALPVTEFDWVDEALATDLVLEDTPGLRAETKRRMASVLAKRALARLTAV